MKSEAEFDAYLTSQLKDEMLPDDGFTKALAATLEQHRRRRHFVLAGGWVTASAVAAASAYASFASLPSVVLATPQTIAAALLLITVCSLVWIETESRVVKVPAAESSRHPCSG